MNSGAQELDTMIGLALQLARRCGPSIKVENKESETCQPVAKV